MLNIKRFAGLAVLSAFLAQAGGALAATAGVFQFVAGEVRVGLAAGNERPAAKGALISVGDTVTTAKASMAQIKMGDGAVIVVQPESRLTVAEFRYAGTEDGTEKVRFRLEQGGFRSVTGAIGHTHKGNYLIETPIAHIGVRGTDHESWYFPSPVSLEGVATEAGLYNRVNVGLTYIQTANGEVAVTPNQVGYVASALDRPRLLDAMPDFFNRSIQPASARRGGSQGDRGPEVADGENRRGLGWGTWQGGLATASARAGNSAMPAIVAANLPATARAAAFPQQVITATYNYVPGSGAVIGTASPGGTINALSVGVNLTTQRISSYSLDASVGSQNWTGYGRGTINQFMDPAGIMIRGNCSGCVSSSAASPGATGSATGGFAGSQMNTSFSMTSAQQQSMSGTGLLAR
ncbi:MAG: FecR family protein [Burkholderiales bacterium]